MIVDVHTHVVPEHFPAAPAEEAAWPSMRHLDGGTAEIVTGGKVFRRIDRRSWDVSARLVDMDRDGIDAQVLSPMPELLSYWFDPNAGARICDVVNDHILTMVAAAPDRFRGFGMVPLQDPIRAAREVARLRTAGIIGIEIGSHVAGTPLGDASLDPVYAAAEAESMTVMVHALHPAGTERIGGAPDMAAAAVFPLETALAATSLIVGGTMERHPDLSVLLCHGGGALATILPRLDHAWRCGLSLSKTISVLPSEIARRFHYDTIVYGAETLRHLIGTVGAERLAMGSDYPFAVMQPNPAGFVRSAAGAAASDILAGLPALSRQTERVT